MEMHYGDACVYGMQMHNSQVSYRNRERETSSKLIIFRGRAKYKKKSKNITHFKTILKRARCKWRLKMTS